MSSPAAATSTPGPPKPASIGFTHPRMRWWAAYVIAVWCVWGYLAFGAGYWEQVKSHWQISVAMTLGSYVAGSTPMGGGTVGFPVLVLLFGLPASLGRNFGLVIQAVGMTSATLFIFCRRGPVAWKMLASCIPGAAIGLLIGTYFVVPRVSNEVAKLVFACLWLSFGLLTLVKNREICGFQGLGSIPSVERHALGAVVGLLGGVTTSMTGVGIEMLLYTLLVLLYRIDVKSAVPTAVIMMAVTSVMGAALHLWIGDIEAEVFYSWMAAVPIVILGAPFGTWVVTKIPRIYTLYVVAVLCVLQFFWTLWVVGPTGGQWTFTATSLVVALAGFTILYRAGKRRAGSAA